MSVSRWGLIHAWLASAEGRGLVISADGTDLVVTAVDGTLGERIERVSGDEDPSTAAWRAINAFPVGTAIPRS